MPKKKNLETKAPLTIKQELFLQNYVKDFNASRAYFEVFNVKSKRVGSTEGARLLADPRVKARLSIILQERAEMTRIDASYVVEYLKGAVELDLEDFATTGSQGVTLKEFKDIDKQLRKYITKVTQTVTKTGEVVVNFEVYSKEKALETLSKHTGVSKENLNHSGAVAIVSFTDLIDKHG